MKKTLFILLIPSISFAFCDPADILPSVRPGAVWTMSNNDLTTQVWKSTQTIPSALEMQTGISNCLARVVAKKQARLDAKNTALFPEARIQALLILLDYDQ